LLRVIDEARETISQEKFSTVSFGFRQERQEDVPHFGGDLLGTQDLQGIRQVQNF
jgi:hypothetical protein